MADEHHLQMLDLGVNTWNDWRKDNPRIAVDLRGANLRGANLRGANLRGANLSDANLIQADLRKGSLYYANLAGTNLSKANLQGVYLTNANFDSTNLSYTDLRGIYGGPSSFAGSNLQGVNLSEENYKNRSFRGANLRGANLRGANLEKANFIQANLHYANLAGANLRGADLRSANLRRAELAGADLTQSDFSGADVTGANFYKAIINKTVGLPAELVPASTPIFDEDQPLELSIAYPRRLSKRYSSSFRITIYPVGKRMILERLLQEYPDAQEITGPSDLMSGQGVVIKLTSPFIDFSEEVIKRLENDINTTEILGTPKDTCEPGIHKIKLSISNLKSNHEYVSKVFETRVVDFAFDHVSRPLLTQTSSAILGFSGTATYMLTFFEQIDKTFGWTIGTAIFAVLAILQARFQFLYRQSSSGANVGPGQP